jgi:hypothetical protein
MEGRDVIPEEYWQLFKQWLWVILLGGLVGAVGAYLFGALLLGPPNEHNSRVILGVDHFIPYGETATNPETLGTMQAEYVQSLGQFAQTPQFMSRLRESLPESLSDLPEQELITMLNVATNPRIFNVTISATGRDGAEAQTLATAAASILVDYAKVSEDSVEVTLTSANEQRRTLLSERLAATYAAIEAKVNAASEEELRVALADFVVRGGETDQFRGVLISLARVQADPNLPFLLSEAAALEAEVSDLARLDGQLALATVTDKSPLFIAVPEETVKALGERPIRGRNLAFLGGLGGLLVGWIAANYLERYRMQALSAGSALETSSDSQAQTRTDHGAPHVVQRHGQMASDAELSPADSPVEQPMSPRRTRRSARSRQSEKATAESPSRALSTERTDEGSNGSSLEPVDKSNEPTLAFGGMQNE